MRNFCELWTERLNLTLKKTIMTALGRPGESPPSFFFKKHYEPNKFDIWWWNGLIMSQKKNEGILFPTEIQVVGSYTDRLLDTCRREWKKKTVHRMQECSKCWAYQTLLKITHQ